MRLTFYGDLAGKRTALVGWLAYLLDDYFTSYQIPHLIGAKSFN